MCPVPFRPIRRPVQDRPEYPLRGRRHLAMACRRNRDAAPQARVRHQSSRHWETARHDMICRDSKRLFLPCQTLLCKRGEIQQYTPQLMQHRFLRATRTRVAIATVRQGDGSGRAILAPLAPLASTAQMFAMLFAGILIRCSACWRGDGNPKTTARICHAGTTRETKRPASISASSPRFLRGTKKNPPAAGFFFSLPNPVTRTSVAFDWCPRGDSNPHDLRRYHLKVVRLPIPPPGLMLLDFSACSLLLPGPWGPGLRPAAPWREPAGPRGLRRCRPGLAPALLPAVGPRAAHFAVWRAGCQDLP